MRTRMWKGGSMLHGSCMAMAASLLLSAAAGAPAAKVEMHAGTMLTANTFKEATSDGIWLVEHFSPYCHHCRDFAPTWIELAHAREHQAQSINFHLGQVDCSVDGDLCDANGVKGYPTIFLYENGEYVEQFKKERTLEKLNTWLDARLPDEPASIASPDSTAAPFSETAVEEDITTTTTTTAAAEGKEATDTDSQDDPVPIANPGDAGESAQKIEQPSPTPEKQQHALFAELEEHKETGAAQTATAAAPQDIKLQQAAVKSSSVEKRVQPNPEGKLLSPSKAALESFIGSAAAAGPAFVKYYAPWCGHCRNLAPTWEKLAGRMRGKVNVIEFNCDIKENKEKCRQEKIQGYPTLVFYNQGERREYRGDRDLKSMVSFAEKAAMTTGLRDISPSELDSVAREDEVFFLYLRPGANAGNGEVETVQAATRTLLGSAPVYQAISQDLLARYKLSDKHSAILAFKDNDISHPAMIYNISSLATSTEGNPASDREKQESEIVGWLHANKHPTLAELTGTNFKDYMEEGQLRKESYVVVAGLSKSNSGGSEGSLDERKEDLRRISRAWRQASKFNPREKPVHFVWVDAAVWAKYLANTYGMKATAKEPQIVIADPIRNRYYATDAKRNPLRLDGRQIFAALESLYEGKLSPKISLTFGERLARWLIATFGWIFIAMGNHPFLTTILGLCAFIVFFCVLVYIADEDSSSSSSSPAGNAASSALGNGRHRHQSGPVHQPKFVNASQSLYTALGGSDGGGVKKD